jgi:hypothetical protein
VEWGTGSCRPILLAIIFSHEFQTTVVGAQETLSDPVEEAVKKLISPYRADDTTVKHFFVCAEKQPPCHRRS